MCASFHRYGDAFFPGTGAASDVGERRGRGYSVNIPLREGVDDATFHAAFKPVMARVLDVFRPGAIVLQCGADSLGGDRLGCFNLTVAGHAEAVRYIQSFGLPTLVTGGGGYTKAAVARCWAAETAVLTGVGIGGLADALPRVATLPLGSGALAGNPFGLDRRALSADLGFGGRVCPNSMDAVSDRDYVAETLFIAAMTMTHLSRWAEDLIIYSSPGYGFVECADAYATGSSLMPQKKNPDALELIRGKAGVAVGNLTGILAVIKGTPLTYNKDLQEAWGLLFGGVDALDACIRIATGVLSTLSLRPDRMAAGLSTDMLATDLAEYLVRKGVPFRETHHVAGAAVRLAEDKGCALGDLTPADLRTLHPLFEDDVVALWDFGASADSRDTEGGASKRSVLEQVDKLKAYLAEQGL